MPHDHHDRKFVWELVKFLGLPVALFVGGLVIGHESRISRVEAAHDTHLEWLRNDVREIKAELLRIRSKIEEKKR